MALAYYTFPAAADSWSHLWREESLQRLLAVAHRDPLSSHLLAHLPSEGMILEAGCGLGQYVTLFRDRGLHMIGGDLSLTALQTHRRLYPASPLAALDLHHMPLADRAMPGLISLGVVEHVEEGPQEMLAEFHRVLAPGGVLLLSVPWVNGYRSLVKRRIEQEQARLRAAGASFYQYAFTSGEVQAFLKRAGFTLQALRPYSPAKGMRECQVLASLLRDSSARSRPKTKNGQGTSAAVEVRGIRRCLYWRPVLHFFAHMILAVSVKPENQSRPSQPVGDRSTDGSYAADTFANREP
jgi:SAM-dependent methyltransferase